jgi:hypothetical protein
MQNTNKPVFKPLDGEFGGEIDGDGGDGGDDGTAIEAEQRLQIFPEP